MYLKKALKIIRDNNKNIFVKIKIPNLIAKIKLLKLNSSDLKELLEEINKNHCNESK